MSSHPATTHAVDPADRWLYRAGGSAAFLIGIGYIVIMPLFAYAGARPTGAEAWLAYLARNTTAWWAILGLSIFTDFLFVPVALALYRALKSINRNAMLLAAAGMILFVVLDLAVTWVNYAALIELSGRYAAAATDVQRTASVAAAQYPSVVVESSLVFIYNTLTLAVGIFLTGLVMRHGIFNKLTAYVGIATGSLGMAAVIGSWFVSTFSAVIIIASLLTTLWVLLVGFRLYQLSRERSSD